jgi:hypothetical protein
MFAYILQELPQGAEDNFYCFLMVLNFRMKQHVIGRRFELLERTIIISILYNVFFLQGILKSLFNIRFYVGRRPV